MGEVESIARYDTVPVFSAITSHDLCFSASAMHRAVQVQGLDGGSAAYKIAQVKTEALQMVVAIQHMQFYRFIDSAIL